MESRIARRRVAWAALALALPCPAWNVLCAGWLPVGVQLAPLGRYPHPPALLLAAPGLAIGLSLTYCIARLVTLRSGWGRAGGLCACAALLAAAPIFSYDCMDGHRPATCSAYRMYYEQISDQNACGDVW